MPNNIRQEILTEISLAPKDPAGNFRGKPFDLNRYLGSPHKLYFLNTPTMRKIAKKWAKLHSRLSAQ